MTFQEPAYLFIAGAGLLVLLLGGLCARKRSRFLSDFSRLHPSLNRQKIQGRRLFTVLAAALTVVLMAVALAGPSAPGAKAGTFRRGIDLVFCVDTSRSMLALEGGESRLDRAIREVRGFLDRAGGSRLGLVAFAGTARPVCPLTHDIESFRHFLDELDLHAGPGAGTALGEGLAEALELLGASGWDRPKVVVLLSDGEDLGTGLPPEEVARKAAAEGVLVYTMMFGAPEGAKIPLPVGGYLEDPEGVDVISRPDSACMARIAGAGNGVFMAVWETAFPLDLLYTEHLAKLNAAAKVEETGKRGKAAYPGFALAALVLLLLDLFLPRRRVGRSAALALLFVLGAPGPLLPEANAVDGFERGVERFRAGDFRGALEAFQEAAEEGDDTPGLQVNLGLSYLALCKDEQAAYHFERALVSDEQAGRAARFGAGLAAHRRGSAILDLEAKLEGPDGELLLLRAKELALAAQGYFSGCLTAGWWPDDAARNLALTQRLSDKIERRLAARVKTFPGKDAGRSREDGASGSLVGGEADDPVGSRPGGVKGMGGEVDRRVNGAAPGDGAVHEGRSEGAGGSHSAVREKERIFALLKALEQKRLALVRARAAALKGEAKR